MNNARALKKNDVIFLNHGYGFEERIVFQYYLECKRYKKRYARGISLTWPGVWQQFDTMKCRRPTFPSIHDFIEFSTKLLPVNSVAENFINARHPRKSTPL